MKKSLLLVVSLLSIFGAPLFAQNIKANINDVLPATSTVIDSPNDRIAEFRVDPEAHRLLAYVVPAAPADPASPEPQYGPSWKTVAGLDGLTKVAIKVGVDGTLMVGADPGGSVERCTDCVLIGGLAGLTPTALKVGSDGTVAISGATLSGTGAPVGSCVPAVLYTDNSTGNLYSCEGATSTWVEVTGAGGNVNLTTDNTWTNNNRFKGPIPWADLSAFARPRPSAPEPTTTATCTATQNTCTFGSVSGFQVNDGVTIRGAGATLTMSTPSGPTVTPSVSAGGMGLGGGNYASKTTVASATGSSTYKYELIARDQTGGYTATGSATTITNGLSSLGVATCAISSMSRSGTVTTVNFTSSCAQAIQGAMMSVYGATSATFSGFYLINTVNSSTQVLISSQYNSNSFGYQSGDSTANSSTGGTATFFLSNHLSWTLGAGVWQYYVCAERPGDGSYKLIGITKPNTTAGQDVQFDDYGSPYNDSQIYPSYITNSLCNSGSAQNDPLTTTITNINGTTVTLAATATNNTSSTTAVFDNAPGFLAAAQSVAAGSPAFSSGRVLIPNTAFNHQFVINSYLKIPTDVSIVQMGQVTANETIELDGNVTWDGSQANNGIVQFAYTTTGGGAVLDVTAVPGIYDSKVGDLLENLTITVPSNTNGGLLELDDASTIVRQNIQYTTSTGTGYLGNTIWYRGSGGANPSKVLLDRCVFTMSSPANGNTSWSAQFYAAPIQNGSGGFVSGPSAQFWITNTDTSLYGFETLSSVSNWHFKNNVRQGGVEPYLWLLGTSSGNIDFDNVFLDTDTSGILSVAQVSTVSDLNVTVNGGNGTAGDTGGLVSPITGSPITNLNHWATNDNLLPNASGFGSCNVGGRASGVTLGNVRCNFDPLLNGGTNSYLFWPLSAPTGQTASAAAGGSSFGSDTFEFEITAVDAAGKETIASAATAGAATSGTCPSSGNCSLTVNATPVVGAVSYNLYACTVNHTIGSQCPSFSNMANETGVSLPVTVTTWTGASFAPPSITTAGTTKISSSQIFAPTLKSSPNATAGIPACGATTEGSIQSINDSTTNTLGATASGGGSFHVQAYCDGTSWKVSASALQVICNGQVSLSASGNSITSGGKYGTSSTVPQTITCTGLSTTGHTSFFINIEGDPSSITGFSPSTSGNLEFVPFVDAANTIGLWVYNPTGSPVTPGSVTLNYMAIQGQ